MNARSLLIIIAALLVAGVTAFLARGWLSAERAQMQQQSQQVVVREVPAQAVLVAAANLPTGLFLKEEHLRWQEWPSDATDPNYLLKENTDLKTLIGSVVRRAITAGEPITGAKIVKPGDRGFLAAVIAPGMRAITVGISETSGVAGLIFPGDRVDLLLTHELPGENSESNEDRRASETVLENVRLLAIGKSLNDLGESPVDGKTATIEVTPKQAEMVAVLVELGRLSLSLRGLANEDVEAVDSVVMTSDAPQTAQPTAAGDRDSLAEADMAVTAEVGAHAPAGESPAGTPRATVPPLDDNPPPSRGQTYTLDSEVSRLIGTNPVGVQVQRGSTSERIMFE